MFGNILVIQPEVDHLGMLIPVAAVVLGSILLLPGCDPGGALKPRGRTCGLEESRRGVPGCEQEDKRPGGKSSCQIWGVSLCH